MKAKALEIIQLLGQTYASRGAEFPFFFQTYTKLTARGCIFPLTEGLNAPKTVPADDPIGKVQRDLKVVKAKLRSSLSLYYSDKETTNYLDLVDFLEQCKPRLELLSQVGSQGGLPDEVLAMCLQVNDEVYRALERLRDPECQIPQRQSIPTTFIAPPVLAKPPNGISMESVKPVARPQRQQFSESESASKETVRNRNSSKRLVLSYKVEDEDESDDDEKTNLLNLSEDSWNSDEERNLLG